MVITIHSIISKIYFKIEKGEIVQNKQTITELKTLPFSLRKWL
jgi:hypothetical protein